MSEYLENRPQGEFFPRRLLNGALCLDDAETERCQRVEHLRLVRSSPPYRDPACQPVVQVEDDRLRAFLPMPGVRARTAACRVEGLARRIVSGEKRAPGGLEAGLAFRGPKGRRGNRKRLREPGKKEGRGIPLKSGGKTRV